MMLHGENRVLGEKQAQPTDEHAGQNGSTRDPFPSGALLGSDRRNQQDLHDINASDSSFAAKGSSERIREDAAMLGQGEETDHGLLLQNGSVVWGSDRGLTTPVGGAENFKSQLREALGERVKQLRFEVGSGVSAGTLLLDNPFAQIDVETLYSLTFARHAEILGSFKEAVNVAKRCDLRVLTATPCRVPQDIPHAETEERRPQLLEPHQRLCPNGLEDSLTAPQRRPVRDPTPHPETAHTPQVPPLRNRDLAVPPQSTIAQSHSDSPTAHFNREGRTSGAVLGLAVTEQQTERTERETPSPIESERQRLSQTQIPSAQISQQDQRGFIFPAHGPRTGVSSSLCRVKRKRNGWNERKNDEEGDKESKEQDVEEDCSAYPRLPPTSREDSPSPTLCPIPSPAFLRVSEGVQSTDSSRPLPNLSGCPYSLRGFDRPSSVLSCPGRSGKVLHSTRRFDERTEKERDRECTDEMFAGEVGVEEEVTVGGAHLEQGHAVRSAFASSSSSSWASSEGLAERPLGGVGLSSSLSGGRQETVDSRNDDVTLSGELGGDELDLLGLDLATDHREETPGGVTWNKQGYWIADWRPSSRHSVQNPRRQAFSVEKLGGFKQAREAALLTRFRVAVRAGKRFQDLHCDTARFDQLDESRVEELQALWNGVTKEVYSYRSFSRELEGEGVGEDCEMTTGAQEEEEENRASVTNDQYRHESSGGPSPNPRHSQSQPRQASSSSSAFTRPLGPAVRRASERGCESRSPGLVRSFSSESSSSSSSSSSEEEVEEEDSVL
uniref:Uncharacterized protein n=1 Tax=Chromera velia CCMP2878 TaxID=1169474 RepID=A0A0G4G1H0_9ALVE|eukprot:Cvel_4005.t1-p1 / transcript=Cvel_4005.t1 / gene=Cvel_4005 / organism=Chromera_velia_CCMP2878 / gene_product=hypothetical protein / transcript_product=hypothetical protein / location=Cvel_scaffold170:62825-66848(-) / protein_length=781 / sequence_SO=supercontig / SO=protein_coding / is_pseudo=false